MVQTAAPPVGSPSVNCNCSRPGKQTGNSALFEDGSTEGCWGGGERISLKNVHRCRATTGGEFWPRSALISQNKGGGGGGARPRQSPHQERDCRSRNIHQFFSPLEKLSSYFSKLFTASEAGAKLPQLSGLSFYCQKIIQFRICSSGGRSPEGPVGRRWCSVAHRI